MTRPFWPILLILAAGIGVYATNLRTAFIYDDFESIVENPHLRTLWPLSVPLTAPLHATLAGRPIVSLSLALNYAVGTLDIRGYRAVNLAIHLLNALLLYALLHRALLSPRFNGRFGMSATALATGVALIWTVHPLLTEAVVYVVQRTELLVTFFYLLTLYLAVKAWAAARPAPWSVAAILACAMGMASKEVMVSAPLFVLVYDATFVSDSFAQAIRRHLSLYVGLAATWLILAALMSSSPRGDTAGFGLRIGALDYLRTQAWAIVYYLWLCFWPQHLAIYEDVDPITRFGAAAPYGVFVLGLLAATLWGLWRRSWLGAAGALFFLVLAPSSSIMPIITEMVAERRMYLPSAAVFSVVIIGGYTILTRKKSANPPDLALGMAFVIAVTLALGARSVLRIRDYKTEAAIWQANLKIYPHSTGTLDALGAAAARVGNDELAIGYYKRAADERPNDYADPRANLGNCYMRLGRYAQAAPWYESALDINANFHKARLSLARCYVELGRLDDARKQLEILIHRDPDNAPAHAELALVLRRQGNSDGALAEFTLAAQLAPDDADMQNNLAGALLERGQPAKALPHLQDALTINPQHPIATLTLGRLLLEHGHFDDAINELEIATAVRPADPEPPDLLAQAYAKAGRPSAAAAATRQAIARARAASQAARVTELERRLSRLEAGTTRP